MSESKDLVLVPDVDSVKSQLAKISQFQAVVKSSLHEGHDYGVIPGTNKPTLLKPGAEKIISLWGARPEFEYISKTEDWDKNFFYYHVRCRIIHVQTGMVLSEGEGSCSSKESKYGFRWEFGTWNKDTKEYDAPPGSTEMRWFQKKGGGKYPKFKVLSEDVPSQVNTIQKMADKRAMVAAALILGRLSDLFTQDLEDMEIDKDEPIKPEPQVQEKEKTWAGVDAKIVSQMVGDEPESKVPPKAKPKSSSGNPIVEGRKKSVMRWLKLDDEANLAVEIEAFIGGGMIDNVDTWIKQPENFQKILDRLNEAKIITEGDDLPF